MPNDLYSSIYQGDFNDPTTDNSGYGALSAAEKNQTYFAYFSSVGGTTPELIDQTAYFVKYLIDGQGNVVAPQPNSNDLLNMLQNFESGKLVNVTSLEGTTLFNTLLGTKQITDVGKIETLLVTETSSIRSEFLPTMSFFQYNSFTQQINNPPNYSFKAVKQYSTNITTTTSATLAFQTPQLNPLGNYNNTLYEYTFNTNTSDYGIEAKFKAGVALQFNSFLTNEEQTYYFSPSDKFRLEIVKSSDNWVTSQSLSIIQLPNNPPSNPQPSNQAINNKQYSGFQLGTLTGATNTKYITIETLSYTFQSGDKVRVQYYVNSWDTSGATAPDVIIFGTPETNGGTFFSLSTNYTNNLQITSSYWDGATYPTPGSNTTQWLTASLGLSGYINNNMVQLTPTASAAQGFNTIYLPANLLPGDYIRFEYDPSKQSRIYNFGTLDDGRVVIEINPPIPTGSILNHFCVYRINPNAGNQIMLNVKKPEGTLGQPLTGFIKPQYMSKELEDNFTTIIQKLSAEGTI
jgi:hypothetical protein